MPARRPSQDSFVLQKATPPTPPLPRSYRGASLATQDLTVPQMHKQVVQHDSIIPETEADATSDDLQFLERRTKSRNEGQWEDREERLTCGEDEVTGRLKRKKGHQRIQPQEKEVRITLQTEDVSQKRKKSASSSRMGPQSPAACDFEDDTAEDSTDKDDRGEDSEGDFQDTPAHFQLGFSGKDSQSDKYVQELDRFLGVSGDEDTQKSVISKKGKKLPVATRKSISRVTRSSQRFRP